MLLWSFYTVIFTPFYTYFGTSKPMTAKDVEFFGSVKQKKVIFQFYSITFSVKLWCKV